MSKVMILSTIKVHTKYVMKYKDRWVKAWEWEQLAMSLTWLNNYAKKLLVI